MSLSFWSQQLQMHHSLLLANLAALAALSALIIDHVSAGPFLHIPLFVLQLVDIDEREEQVELLVYHDVRERCNLIERL